MTVPKLSQLRRINELVDTIETLQSRISVLETTLAHKKEENRLALNHFEEELSVRLQNQAILKRIEADLITLKNKEKELKQEIVAQLQTEVANYLTSQEYLQDVADLIQHLAHTSDESIVVEAPESISFPGSPKVQFTKTNQGTLRVIVGHKTYILDTQVLHAELLEYLLHEYVPTAL